jgi:hypothetical protein
MLSRPVTTAEQISDGVERIATDYIPPKAPDEILYQDIFLMRNELLSDVRFSPKCTAEFHLKSVWWNLDHIIL